MEYKILNNQKKFATIPLSYAQRGTTLVELVVVSVLITALFAGALLALNVPEYLRKGRDEKRLSDISVLERMIAEYRIENNTYPGDPDTTYSSNVLPSSHAGPVENATYGWLPDNMSAYRSSLPIDPINSGEYVYRYRFTETTFELNAVLEHFADLAANDGGDDAGVYEVGTKLDIL